MRDQDWMRERDWGFPLRAYRSLSPALCQAAVWAAPFNTKLADGVQGRQGLMERLLAARERVRGGIWFHVTSVGEYEQARPIIAAIRQQQPTVPVAVTHFSPSGYDFALRRPIGDVHDYLPFDHPADMAHLVQAWQPRLLVFVKFDCWPNQVMAAVAADVPVVLLAGSLQPASARLRPLARPLFRDLFDRFAHIGVCTAEDERRFVEQLGVSAPVSVTGDTRVEQVILRYEAAQAGETCRQLRRLGGRLLVLGSTWPPDEQLWLPILGQLLTEFPDLRVVLTPHEPTPLRLQELERKLAQLGLQHQRLSTLMAGPEPTTDHPARVVLVDSIGVLAEIYRAGHLAYVGGSFTTGVHNTMEPAVARMPVLFGPVIQNAEEAGVLVQRGAGFVLENPEQALARGRELLGTAGLLGNLGDLAREVVLAQRGATARSMTAIASYL